MAQFETKFQVSEDGDLIYNLKQGKGFTRGVPNMTNDVMIRVSQQSHVGLAHPPAFMKELAQEICDMLNKNHTFDEDMFKDDVIEWDSVEDIKKKGEKSHE